MRALRYAGSNLARLVAMEPLIMRLLRRLFGSHVGRVSRPDESGRPDHDDHGTGWRRRDGDDDILV